MMREKNARFILVLSQKLIECFLSHLRLAIAPLLFPFFFFFFFFFLQIPVSSNFNFVLSVI